MKSRKVLTAIVASLLAVAPIVDTIDTPAQPVVAAAKRSHRHLSEYAIAEANADDAEAQCAGFMRNSSRRAMRESHAAAREARRYKRAWIRRYGKKNFHKAQWIFGNASNHPKSRKFRRLDRLTNAILLPRGRKYPDLIFKKY